MSPTSIGLLVLGALFFGAVLGMFLRAALPEQHLSADLKDAIKLGTGLIAIVCVAKKIV
jgi:hypothetical protein